MVISSTASSVSIYYHDKRKKPEKIEPTYLATVELCDRMLIVSGTYGDGVDADHYSIVYPLDGVREVLVGSAK